jgi:hypothetical protein
MYKLEAVNKETREVVPLEAGLTRREAYAAFARYRRQYDAREWHIVRRVDTSPRRGDD